MSFPITCTACHKTFTISDEIYEKKVAGRAVTIKCKSCGHGIRIDGSKGAASAPPETTPLTAAPSDALAEPLWAVDYSDGQDREFTTPEVLAELERGAIDAQTLIWRDGMEEWLELAQVPELAPELGRILERRKAEAEAKAKAEAEAKAKVAADAAKARAKAAAESKAKATEAPVHTPRAPMPTVTGLGGGPSLGAPKAKSVGTPSPDLKPRGPLGSSPHLKPRAPLGSAPDVTPRMPLGSVTEVTPRAPLGSAPEVTPRVPFGAAPEVTPRVPLAAVPDVKPSADPAPSVVATPLPAASPFTPAPLEAPARASFPAPTGALGPTPPLPASVAEAVSKPPPVPASGPSFPMSTSPAPTFGTLPAVVSDHASVEWPESKRKTPLIILGLVAAALAAFGAYLVMGGKDELPPPTPITGTPTQAATPPNSPTVSPTARSQPGAETASGSDPIVATPGAGFAELFAAGARKAESKGASVATAARFDPAVTKAPLAEAATEAQACKQSGGPTGKVTVVVTFDPNGKAAGATITDAPFAGTATASCISAAMKRASIPPFSGLPGTVSKTFTLL
jgi:hypothetical protein